LKIVWLSSRFLGGDLSSTTQIQLANGLVNKGHTVDLYSPGKSVGNSFAHHQIERSGIKGLQARSVAKNLKNRVSEFKDADVVLIDWPIFTLARDIDSPVILMDRSPPADKGIFAKLQWSRWSKAWSKAIRGTVVSAAHRIFVADNTQTPKASIGVIPAGVDLDLFQIGEKEGPIRMVYHGRVDINRGIMVLPMILAGLQSQGIEATLHIHGSGDAVKRLKNIGMEGLKVTDAIPQHEVAELLSNYDMGFLPMPKNKVWNLASPLKRSEYLASGLVVCGIDHEGHRIPESGDWLQLYNQDEFISRTVDWIISLDRQLLTALQKESRRYAEEKLSWSHSVDVLESMILS
jgi:glycosyltransferase involved in cell wall biosynthesis